MQLISRIRDCGAYASTNVAGLAILLVFVRYPFDKRIEDDLLLYKSLELHSTGNHTFNIIDDFVKAHDISWKNAFRFVLMDQSQ